MDLQGIDKICYFAIIVSFDKETGLPRILLVKYYPDGKDLFSVIEIKPTGRKSQLVTTARVGKNYLRLLKKIR